METQGAYFEYPDAYYNTRSAEQVLPILFSKYHPASMLDVGCGNGSWLKVAESLGISDLMGVDIQEPSAKDSYFSNVKFSLVDLNRSFDLHRKFDMVLCLEVAEHLPENDASLLIENLARHSDLIIFSAAIPRQGGFQHLNEREPAFWQQLFNQHGYNTYDEIRPLIWNCEEVLWWYRQNIFIADRRTIAERKPSENIPYLIHPAHYREKEANRQMLADNKFDLLNDVSLWKQRDQSIMYHLRRIVRLIISGNTVK